MLRHGRLSNAAVAVGVVMLETTTLSCCSSHNKMPSNTAVTQENQVRAAMYKLSHTSSVVARADRLKCQV